MVSAFDYGELHDLIANFCILLIAKLLSRRKKTIRLNKCGKLIGWYFDFFEKETLCKRFRSNYRYNRQYEWKYLPEDHVWCSHSHFSFTLNFKI